MKKLLFLAICISTILACSKDDEMQDINDPAINLEDVIDDWNIELSYKNCSSISVKFNFDIVGDSMALQNFGYVVSNIDVSYSDTVRQEHVIDSPFFYDYFLNVNSRSQLDPALTYDIIPFVEVSGSIFYGESQSYKIGNFTEIEMESLLDLRDYNLGYNYISEASAVRLGNKGYLIGGLVGNDPDPETQTVSNIVLEIDFENKTITEIEPIPRAAKSMISFIYNGEIYAGGGSSEILSGPITTIYKYKPSVGWETVSDYPGSGGMAGGYAHTHGDYVYMGLGVDMSGILTGSRNLYRLDPRDNTWTSMRDLNHEASGGSSFLIENNIYVSHGYGSAFSKYDIETDQWSHVSNSNQLQDAVSFVRGGKGYAYSGGFSKTGNSVYVYDPKLDEWTETCIENSDFRTYEGVIFDDGISDPIVGFGTNSKMFTLRIP